MTSQSRQSAGFGTDSRVLMTSVMRSGPMASATSSTMVRAAAAWSLASA